MVKLWSLTALAVHAQDESVLLQMENVRKVHQREGNHAEAAANFAKDPQQGSIQSKIEEEKIREQEKASGALGADDCKTDNKRHPSCWEFKNLCNGWYTGGNSLVEIKVGKKEQCQAKCFATENCDYAVHVPTKGRCTLVSGGTADAKLCNGNRNANTYYASRIIAEESAESTAGKKEKIMAGLKSLAASSPKGFPVKFFKNEDVLKEVPLPPDDYPEQLKGLIWMDHAGYYAHTGKNPGVPDGVFGFGDLEFGALERNDNGGVVNVDTTGPAFQWFNSGKGYMFYNLLSSIGFSYRMNFTDNFNHCHIQPILDAGGFTPGPKTWFNKEVEVPREMLNFEMAYQSLYLNETACPRHLTKEIEACLGPLDPNIDPEEWKKSPCYQVKLDAGKCGKWKRITNFKEGAESNYFAFEIVDNNGQKREPYFSMAMNYIRSQASPVPADAQAMLHDVDGDKVKDADRSFIGVRPDGVREYGEQCDGNWECRSKCCTGFLRPTCGNC